MADILHGFGIGAYDAKQKKNINLRVRRIQELYAEIAKRASRIAQNPANNTKGGYFSVEEDKHAKTQLLALVRDYMQAMRENIRSGNAEAWSIADKKNDAIVNALVTQARGAGKHISRDRVKSWKQRNQTSLAAFQKRADWGMELSGRIWELGNQMNVELETALALGIAEGKSADALSRDVRKHLKEPNRLFRRVRDKETGELHLSKAAQAYHPGRGKYRSSYKNALRLTATENNIAYRTADHERHQQLDFILGIEIHTSDNHPEVDICDELKGVYPKEFKFTGWHPFCRCYTTTVLPSREEFYKYAELDEEEAANYHFKGEVKDMPKQFTDWLDNNQERIAKAKSMPYFLRDNGGMTKEGYKLHLFHNKGAHKTGLGDWSSREAKKQGELAYNGYDSKIKLTEAQKVNAERTRKVLEKEKNPHIETRDFWEADSGIPNELGGDKNCVNVVVANELLRRGINVTATTKYIGSAAEDRYNELFLTKNGKTMPIQKIGNDDADTIMRKLEKRMNVGERYFLAGNDKSTSELYRAGKISKDDVEGHIVSAEMTPSGLVIYDHQKKSFVSIKAMLNDIDLKNGIEYFRIDNMLIDYGSPILAELVQAR